MNKPCEQIDHKNCHQQLLNLFHFKNCHQIDHIY
jgi:hypothetical protein